MADEFVQVVKISVDDSELRAAIERLRSAIGGGAGAKSPTDSLEKGMKKAGKEAKKTADEAAKVGNATKEATKETSKLAAAFDKMKGAVTGLVGAYMGFKGISELVGFGKGSIEAFSTQRKQELMLDTVLKNGGMAEASSEIKKHASAIQDRTTIGNEAMIAGAAELSTYVKDPEQLKRMMNLLADYSMGMTGGAELSPEAVSSLATGLGKAFDGTYDAMRKKGFDTSELETIAGAEKLLEEIEKGNVKRDKKTGELKLSNDDKELLEWWEEHKGQNLDELKIAALETAMSDWKGLAEEFAKTDEGKITQLKNTIGDMREDIGAQLLPVLGELAGKLKENLPELQKIFQNFADILMDWGRTIAENFDAIASFASTIGELIKFIATNIKYIVNFKIAMSLIGPMFKKTAVDMSMANTQVETSTKKAAMGISQAAAQISAAGTQAAKSATKLASLKNSLGALKGMAVSTIVAISASKIEEAAGAAWELWKQWGKEDEFKANQKEKVEYFDKMIDAYKAYKNGGTADINKRRDLEKAVSDYRAKNGSVPEYVLEALGEKKEAKPDVSAEKKEAKGGNTVNNISYTNNIEVNEDELGKRVRENLRTLLTSSLTFEMRSETARAMAL